MEGKWKHTKNNQFEWVQGQERGTLRELSPRWTQANSGVNLSDGLEILHSLWFLVNQIFSLRHRTKIVN